MTLRYSLPLLLLFGCVTPEKEGTVAIQRRDAIVKGRLEQGPEPKVETEVLRKDLQGLAQHEALDRTVMDRFRNRYERDIETWKVGEETVQPEREPVFSVEPESEAPAIRIYLNPAP